MAGPRGRRESFAERRARRAVIEDPAVVLDAAARFLETRSRSVAEVRRRLTSAGYRGSLIDGAIERLLELGILDDEAFARAWVESRDRARPRGERAIRAELVLKGVDRASIDLVLAERREAVSDADPSGRNSSGGGSARGRSQDRPAASADRAAAERLLGRHLHVLARVADPRRRRQRAYQLLARNGFDPEICREVASGELADPGVDDPGVDDPGDVDPGDVDPGDVDRS